MKAPAFSENNPDRPTIFYIPDLPGTPDEQRFERLARVARRCLCASISVISLTEKESQWLMSCSGLRVTDPVFSHAVCALVVCSEKMIITEDTRADDRFRDHPLVRGEPFIRFYAGYPLRLPDGALAGTLCVMDTRPRIPDDEEISFLTDIASLVEDELHLIRLALTDSLTGLLNRRGFFQRGERYIHTRNMRGETYCMVMLDLDNLKPVNDVLGHLAGDRLLHDFATILKKCAAQTDIIARLGGDEFIVLTDRAERSDVLVFINDMNSCIDALNASYDPSFPLSYSWGVSINPAGGTPSLAEMLARSDHEMYQTKRAKKHLSSSQNETGHLAGQPSLPDEA